MEVEHGSMESTCKTDDIDTKGDEKEAFGRQETNHIETETNNKSSQSIPCQQCEFVAQTIPDVVAHIVKTHTQRTVQCDFCDFGCSDREELDAHLKNDHDGFTFLKLFADQQSAIFQNIEQFKEELTGILNAVIKDQHAYKEELLKIKLNQTTDKKMTDLEKSIMTLTNEVRNSLQTKWEDIQPREGINQEREEINEENQTSTK